MSIPKNYLQGIDYLKYEVERKYPSFLLGEWKTGSWWYYYLFTTLVKTPEATLIAAGLGVFVLIVCLWRRTIPFEAASMLALLGVPAIVMFASVSYQGGFNHHHRYVLNIYPFLWALAVLPVARFAPWPKVLRPVTIGLTVLMVVSSLSVAPHFLSYFNWASGGPKNGWKLLAFSNIDWGQDLLYVDKWIKAHPECRPLAMELYHQATADWFDVPGLDAPHLPTGASASEIEVDEPTWYIINVRLLYNKSGQPGYEYFQQLEPVDRIAYAYHVYRIDPKEERSKDGWQDTSATD